MATPEDKRITKYYNDKRCSSKIRGIECNLSKDDVRYLLNEAGITIWGVGRKGYYLSRHNDQGPYEIGNCEFKWWEDNVKEAWTNLTPEEQEKKRQVGRENGHLGGQYGYLGPLSKSKG